MANVKSGISCQYCSEWITQKERAKDGRTCKRCQHYWKKYKIRTNDYKDLYFKQGGFCAICGKIEPGTQSGAFCVDHCHVTNKVRGLLCVNCNTGIGALKEDPEIFSNALSYLTHGYTRTN